MPEVDALRVLVVDDDPAALRLLEEHVSTGGYDVVTAGNGTEALNIVLTEPPSMVITDWMMPEMDGLELCRTIRESEGIGFIYIMVLTAHADKDRAVEAFEAGADDYLSKPADRKELLARLRAAERIIKLTRALDKRESQVRRYNAEIAITNAKLTAANEKLQQMATTDELTRLVNRRAAMTKLEGYWAAADRHGGVLSCIMLDVDDFKRVNDTHGHAIGDQVLKATAAALAKVARSGEDVCRLGGEEFLILCPNSTAAQAAVGAERMRMAVEGTIIRLGDLELTMTISAGVAERLEGMSSPDDLLKAADEALYTAKRSGRNRVGRAPGDWPAPQAAGARDHSTHPNHALPVEPGPADSPTKVLVVDDDPSACSLCRHILQREGYEVSEACDGLDALAQVARCLPDLIVMDAVMPRLDGLECTRRLKADPGTREIPIIMVSARAKAEDIEAGLEAGVDEYITKPFKHKEFILRVRSMARLYRGRAELMRSNEARGEQARAMGVLLELSRDLITARSLDTIVERVVEVAAELLCSRRISVMLPDPEGEHLIIAKAVGIDSDLAATIRVPIGGAIAGQVFLTGEAVVVNTPEEAKWNGHHYDSRFFASVPLICQALGATDHVVGVLNVTERAGGRPFDPRDLEFADLLCNMAASVIDDFMSRQARDEAHDSVVGALATLAEYRDTDTGKHLDRVTGYALIIAEELQKAQPFGAQIDDQFLRDLRRAMPLHDIGKVAIPDRILLKPGKLTPAETAIMRRHAVAGAATLRSIMTRAPGARFLRVAEQIAYNHHERYDGSGYPRCLRGQDIPLAARIAALADVYDALTTKRPYKEAMSHQRAAQIIREGYGSQFDPAVIEAFCRREADFVRLATEYDDPTRRHEESEPTVQQTAQPVAAR